MANLTISQLPVTTSLSPSDVLPTVANGTTYQISVTNLINSVTSSQAVSSSYALTSSYSSPDNLTVKQQVGIGSAPVGSYPLYITSSVNDGSIGVDSTANINAFYFLKNGSKKFELSMDTGTTGIFRLLPYSSSTFFQIGNPSNASHDYIFVSEFNLGNVLIGPGIANGTVSLPGSVSTDKVQVKGNLYVCGSTKVKDDLVVNGSISVSQSLLLPPQDPLPIFPAIGSLATSGSSLYFYNGSGSGGWAKII